MLSKSMFVGLLVTTALASPAFAQQAPQKTTGTPQETIDDSHSPESQVGQIVVTARRTSGGGQMVAADASVVVQTISREYIASQGPTANPAQLIANLPSVNVSSADAFGLVGGTNVQIHGLSSYDLGFVLDGAPVYSSGAGYSVETINPHDLTTVSVTPGSSTLDMPTTGSAAGTLYLTMRDPAKKAGGTFDVAGGTEKFNMQFLRLDSGEIGNSGIRAFVSVSHARANNWRGGGYNDNYHIDFKALKDWNNGSRFALEGSLHREYDGYFYYPSADQFKNYDATFNDWNVHKTYQNFGDTSFYKLNQQTPSYVIALLAPLHVVVSDKVTFDDTPYFWSFLGAGTGGTVLDVGSAYQGSQLANVDLTDGGKITPTNGQVLIDSGFRAFTYQYGNVAKVTANVGANTITAGFWHDGYLNQDRSVAAKANQKTGEPLFNMRNPAGWYYLANGQPYYTGHSNQRYNLNSLFIGDKISVLNDSLKITAGGKYVNYDMTIDNFLPGATPTIKTHSEAFLPQAQVKYNINGTNSVYAAYQEDFRMPFTWSIVQGFDLTTGNKFSDASHARPERAKKIEIGYRYQGSLVQADISFFDIELKDHLLSLTTIQNGQTFSGLANVGGQTSRGVDFQIGAKPINHFSPYFAFEYLDSRTKGDLPVINTAGNADFLPTDGKYSTQAPKYQASLGLTYENGPILISGRGRWVAKQYSTLMNDEAIPGYINDDWTVAYKLKELGPLNSPKLQLNISNLFNRRFLNGVNFTPFNALDTIGRNGGVIGSAGSPNYFVQPKFSASLSLSANF